MSQLDLVVVQRRQRGCDLCRWIDQAHWQCSACSKLRPEEGIVSPLHAQNLEQSSKHIDH